MILFCIETCGSTFFLQQQLGVFQCAVVWPPTQGGWSDESATAYLGVGDVLGGGGERERNDVPLLLIYQQNLLLLFRGLKHMLYKTRGGGEREGG